MSSHSKLALYLGIIPARANSTRFPSKLLASLHGKPVIQHVWEAASGAHRLGKVLIATDDETIATVSRNFGASVRMTGSHFQSGTDRIASVAREEEAKVIVNIQGDEPFLTSRSIDALVEGLEKNSDWDVATLVHRSEDKQELTDPNCVKVALSQLGQALYFSREALRADVQGWFWKHIGIYAYRRNSLFRFCELPVSRLEATERLEQLRALEAGMKIGAVECKERTLGIDTPEDLVRAEKFFLRCE